MFFLARAHDPTFGAGTWIGREQGKLANLDTTPKKYVASLYWAVTTFATVGYGDFFPVTVAESLWTMGYMLFNVALTAFIVGTITLLVVRRDARTSSYRERSQSLRSFAAVNQLPEGLKASMQEHLRLSFANEDIADERVLGELTEDYLSFFCCLVKMFITQYFISVIIGQIVISSTQNLHALFNLTYWCLEITSEVRRKTKFFLLAQSK